VILNENKKPLSLVPAEEEQQVGRALLSWFNGWPEKPVRRISFEYLPEEGPAMSLITIQAAYKIRQYILGGYRAQYQFKIAYRVRPSNDNARLEADELLNRLGSWAELNPDKPQLEGRARVLSVRRDSNAAIFGTYEDGTQDHQILMNLIYEVI